MEFFHLLKASQKSGKKDAVIWFTAKSAARANLQLDVALEEAGIEETGRGKDYAKPIRTDFPVVNDLPEEGTVDYTWCDRYTLGEDGRSWSPVLGEAGAAGAPVVNVETQPTQPAADAELRPLSRLRLIQRLIAHLMHDKELDQITLAQHMEIGVMEGKDENCFVQALRLAVEYTPGIRELSAHVEWKLLKAVKAVFPQDQSHDASMIVTFINGWVAAEASERAQLVEDWLSGKLPAYEIADTSEPCDGEFISAEGVSPEAAAQAEELVQEFREKEMTVLHAVPTLSFRHRLLAQFITEKEYAYHIDNEQLATVRQLEMDTDNSYVQNLLLAAENVEGMKKLRDFEFWRLTDAVKRVFPAEKATPDLALMLQFMKVWKTTDYIDRGLLAKEWINGNRVSTIQRTDTGTNAGGGIKTDRNADYEHTLDTLDVEIACATLPMDFDIYNIPGSIHRRAKEIVAAKESPWKEWSAALRKTAGILDYSRAAIFALIREASSGITSFPDRMTGYISAKLNEYKHDTPEARILAAARQIDSVEVVAGVIEGTEPVESPEALSTEYAVVGEAAAEVVQSHQHETTAQPEVANLGGGVFSIEGLLGEKANPVINPPSNEVAKQEAESVENVQMEETDQSEKQAGAELPAVEGTYAQAVSLTSAEILAARAPELARDVAAGLDQKITPAHQDEPKSPEIEPETPVIEPKADMPEPEAAAQQWPAYFEPGRYEGLPNDVYHAANGISSTMVKDARVSLMYFNARHVSKTIQKERSKVLDMGNLVHALALQPETLAAEFSIEPEIPEGALTTTATIRTCIDEYNASLPPQLSADDIKALLEAHNATLPTPLPLGGAVDETAESYMALPEEFQRIESDKKQTAAAMKACIKEYNATLPVQAKTSGSRDALLEQLAIVNPDLVAQEAQKPAPLKVSGTKVDLIQALKAVRPDAVFADELLDAWRENPEGKVLVTRQQYATALAIQAALHAHPTAGKLLLHPDRAVETSYFGIDDETGLEIRVRPDLELDVDGVRIGADLKTISMWNIKQSGLRAKLHREIIDRDYHLSAGMYMETASLDQFFWIFVNKDEGYHWIAIVEASPELVELGILEYRATMRAIANAFDTGEWPAPITNDYTDELNDYDLRRLEALRTA
ncbi:RecE family exodeoxyribonuclease [Pseudescherichia vulneris]|uniref:RecE family exodeoxyribonuclease n=1 Tax=Pseudescherichia vulneris TaxID=566 RepID=UPI001EE002EA|nr:RecE family exodeoxyribonuclease [Pseudescherichia vulneris]